ncbi:MAG: LuxR C-terminal-related transcriptional regulator [Paramuribaculum sp.]|nr:LuxR C-terminal-related transcriptional regulator [Paramuribaculum sp.]
MKTLHIGILSQSYIYTQGVISLLQQVKDTNIICHLLESENIEKQITAKSLSVILADPLHPGAQQIAISKTQKTSAIRTPLIALSTGLMPQDYTSMYDMVLSVYDSPETIVKTILKHSSSTCTNDTTETKTDLTPREKDIVIGIVKGLSNKEIATEINVSVNTVMTHRRNIASKLQIHSPAGLTIYAIVSKLVSIDEISHTIN